MPKNFHLVLPKFFLREKNDLYKKGDEIRSIDGTGTYLFNLLP